MRTALLGFLLLLCCAQQQQVEAGVLKYKHQLIQPNQQQQQQPQQELQLKPQEQTQPLYKPISSLYASTNATAGTTAIQTTTTTTNNNNNNKQVSLLGFAFARASPQPSPSAMTEDELRKLDMRRQPWKYNLCHNTYHACQTMMLAGSADASLETKACWVHQDQELFENHEATIMCKEPLLKCNCSNDPMWCSKFFQQAGCKSDRDRGGLCTSVMSNSLTFFLNGPFADRANAEAENGSPRLLIALKKLYDGALTGHTVPDWLFGDYCSMESNAMSSMASSASTATKEANAAAQNDAAVEAAAEANGQSPNGGGGALGGPSAPGGEASGLPPAVGLGWRLVRRVGPNEAWHQATDKLQGTDVYGAFTSNTKAPVSFSIDFSTFEFNQFLFMTGDQQKWLITTKSDVFHNGAPYDGHILKSSTSASPYTAKWYNRLNNPEEPWICMKDYDSSINTGDILYGEASFTGPQSRTVLMPHNGANVFIRQYVPGMDNAANKNVSKNATIVQDELPTPKFPDYEEITNQHIVQDNRPCSNDSTDSIWMANENTTHITPPDPAEPRLLCLTSQLVDCRNPAPAQFDDEKTVGDTYGVVCQRGSKMEGPCGLRGTPCARYADQLPYYTPSRMPCRRRPSTEFLIDRPPEKDAPDVVSNTRWNAEMETQDKAFPPPLDPDIDPGVNYVPLEKKIRPRPIGGDEDAPDVLIAAKVSHKPSQDMPYIVRDIDRETPEAASARHYRELHGTRQRDIEIRERKQQRDADEAAAQRQQLRARLRQEIRQKMKRQQHN